MGEIVFHNCNPVEDTALVVSIGSDPATGEQLDALCQVLNSDEEIKALLAVRVAAVVERGQ